jgi:hypothetical protein
MVNLGEMNLIDEDMKIIGSNLLENNTVMNKKSFLKNFKKFFFSK